MWYTKWTAQTNEAELIIFRHILGNFTTGIKSEPNFPNPSKIQCHQNKGGFVNCSTDKKKTHQISLYWNNNNDSYSKEVLFGKEKLESSNIWGKNINKTSKYDATVNRLPQLHTCATKYKHWKQEHNAVEVKVISERSRRSHILLHVLMSY